MSLSRGSGVVHPQLKSLDFSPKLANNLAQSARLPINIENKEQAELIIYIKIGKLSESKITLISVVVVASGETAGNISMHRHIYVRAYTCINIGSVSHL